MNPKTVVILVAALTLAGAALLLTRPGKVVTNSDATPANAQHSDARVIPDRALGKGLQSIRIAPKGASQEARASLRFTLLGGRWDIVYPHAFPANIRSIDALLAELASVMGRVAAQRDGKASPTNLDDTITEQGSIDSDSAVVELTNDAGETWSLTLGPRLGAGRAVLLLSTPDGRERTYHATDTLHDYLAAFDAASYYARRLDAPLMPEVGRIEIATPEGNAVFLQEVGRWWSVTDAGKERALETSLPGYPGLKDYFDLTAAVELGDKQTSYPAQGLATFGLQQPLISVRFVPLDRDANEPGQGYEIHIGTPADVDGQTRYISDGYAGQAAHPVFTTDAQTALAFAQNANAFRDPRITAMPIALIQSVAMAYPDRPDARIDIGTGQDATLTQRPGAPAVAIRDRCIELLRQLGDARASDSIVSDFAALDRLVQVELRAKLGRGTESFAIFRDPASDADGPTVLVRRGDEPVALRVLRASIEGLLSPETLIEVAR